MGTKAYLALANGAVYEGTPFGAGGTRISEIVFATGMTGYMETLSDRSYYGQTVVQTFPLIGNYGAIPGDIESDGVHVSGYIVRELCESPSNFRAAGKLNDFLAERGVIGLCGVDTRAIVRLIREQGVMNGMITDDRKNIDFDAIKRYEIKNAVSAVTTKNAYTAAAEHPKYKVALLDFGLKENIIRELNARGCDVAVLPADCPPQTILELSPDGVMLTNGPGDPAENTQIIENLRALSHTGIPIFGICLGHQLLALASGCNTYKLKYGHRGANQPVKDLETGRVYISSQNHGYAVDTASLDPRVGSQLFENVNDGTCEGIRYRAFPAFTTQFHPEACGGPHDTGFMFDKFTEMMEARHAV